MYYILRQYAMFYLLFIKADYLFDIFCESLNKAMTALRGLLT